MHTNTRKFGLAGAFGILVLAGGLYPGAATPEVALAPVPAHNVHLTLNSPSLIHPARLAKASDTPGPDDGPAAGSARAAPTVDLASVNPEGVVKRGLCFTVGLTDAAASECGALRIDHPLPTTRAMNVERTPTLVYNSQLAAPHPVVAANVTLNSAADSVTAVLRVDGRERASGRWSGWPTGTPHRVAVAFNALSDPTNVYRYTLDVTAFAGGVGETTRATGALAIVNRSGSPFGAGWWLAGVEQLVLDPAGVISHEHDPAILTSLIHLPGRVSHELDPLWR